MELQSIQNHKTSKTAVSRTNLDSSPSRSQPHPRRFPYSLHLSGKHLLSNKRGGKEKAREGSGERKNKEREGRVEIDKREKHGEPNEGFRAWRAPSLQEIRLSEALNQEGARIVPSPGPVADLGTPAVLYAGANKASTSPPEVPKERSTDDRTLEAGVTPRKPIEINFNRAVLEDIGSNWFVAKREEVPNDLATQWNRKKGIKHTLDSYIFGLMKDTQAGYDIRDHLSIYPKPELKALNTFFMAGPRDGTKLRVQPTVIVYCTAEGATKKIEEHLAHSKPGFLVKFGQEIKVCYKKGKLLAASVEESQIGALNPLLENPSLVRTVFIEHNTTAEGFGLRLRFEIQAANLMQTCYSRLGGILYINGLCYGMTTAHTLFIPSKDIGTITEDTTVGYEGAVSPSSAAGSAPSESLYPSGSDWLYESPKVQSEWLVLRNPVITWSFQGQRTKFSERSVIHSPSINDWALIPISSPHFVYGSNNSSRPLHVIQELKLHAGRVSIRSGTEKSCEGFLTQTSSSLHTLDAVIDVREILLDVELFEGASGSWVFRDDGVCGYIIAFMGSKLSCLMIPMEDAFQDIEEVLGGKVQFSRNNEDAIVSTPDDIFIKPDDEATTSDPVIKPVDKATTSDPVIKPVDKATTSDPVFKPDDGARSRKRTSSHSYQTRLNAFRSMAELIGNYHQSGNLSASMAQDICTIVLAWTEILHILETKGETISERGEPILPKILTVYEAYGQQLLRSLNGKPILGFNLALPPIVARPLYYLRGLPRRTREHAAALTRLLQVMQAEVIKYPKLRHRFLVTTAQRASENEVCGQIADLRCCCLGSEIRKFQKP